MMAPARLPTVTAPDARCVLIARFGTVDGASQAVEVLGGAFPGRVGSSAILRIQLGLSAFVVLKDRPEGRGALVGGLMGIVATSMDLFAGDGIRVLAGLLVERGVPEEPLSLLGEGLAANQSAVVIDLGAETATAARRRLRVLGACEVMEQEIGPDLAHLFCKEPPPEPASGRGGRLGRVVVA